MLKNTENKYSENDKQA